MKRTFLLMMTVIAMLAAPVQAWAVAPVEMPTVEMISPTENVPESPQTNNGRTLAEVRKNLERAPYDAVVGFDAKNKKIFEEARVAGNEPVKAVAGLKLQGGILVERYFGQDNGLTWQALYRANEARVKKMVIIFNSYTYVLTPGGKNWPLRSTIAKVRKSIPQSDSPENAAKVAKTLGIKLKVEPNRATVEFPTRLDIGREQDKDPGVTKRTELGENFFTWARNAWRMPGETAGVFALDPTFGTKVEYSSYNAWMVSANNDSGILAEYRSALKKPAFFAHTHPQVDGMHSWGDIKNMVSAKVPVSVVISRGRIAVLAKENPLTPWPTKAEMAELAEIHGGAHGGGVSLESRIERMEKVAEKCGFTFKVYPLTTIFPDENGYNTEFQRDLGVISSMYASTL